MKTVICDLKNTLVDEDGTWRVEIERLLNNDLRPSLRLVLYSMNERWTYTVLKRYSQEFATFDQILLVGSKQLADLQLFSSENVIVFGDSTTEELEFARICQFDAVNATQTGSFDELLRCIGENYDTK